MAFFKICVVFALASAAAASPAVNEKGLAATFEEMRSLCNNEDPIACIKFKALNFLDSLFKKNSFQLSEYVDINRNTYRSNEVGRSEGSLEDNIEQYIKSHDVTFKLPVVGSTVTLGSRNLDSDEIDLKVQFSDSSDVQARKSKLKKIFIPILMFVLLKAITVIPLALGILGLKAWNALQLSFFSFVVSLALAVFQLCKKIASDNAPPAIASHGPWEAAYSSHYKRSFDIPPDTPNASDAQEMAYSAYRQ